MQLPSLRRPFAATAVGSLLAATLLAQTATPTRSAPPRVLAGFDTRRAVLQDLALPQGSVPGFTIVVRIDGHPRRIDLRAHDVRAPGFALVATDANGRRTLPRPANTTYRGTVAGHPRSVVAGSLIGGQLTALLQLDPTQPMWNIQPLTAAIPGAARQTHVIHSERDSTTPRYRCGVPAPRRAPAAAGRPSPANMGPVQVCEIGLDADFDDYRRHGSNVNNTAADAAAIINACNVIYRRDVQIEFQISRTIVRTSRVYTTRDFNGLLSQFGSRWMNQHAGVRRDVAHLFTGKAPTTGVIGVAWLSSICDRGLGYGLSFTHFSGSFTSRVGLTAHELGHNFGADHCAGGSCYIMCPGLGGCGRNLTRFGTTSIQAIRALRNRLRCLHLRDAPHVTGIAPTSVQAFAGGTVTVTGTGFTRASQLNFGQRALTPGASTRTTFRIVNDTRIEFDSPRATTPLTTVSVQDNIGRGREEFVQYVPTQPRKLEATPLAVRGQEMKWEWGAGPRHNWFLTISVDPTTFQLAGLAWLTRPTILLTGTNNAAGTGGFKVTVPANSPVGLRFYSQLVTVNPFLVKFGGNTNVPATRIQ